MVTYWSVMRSVGGLYGEGQGVTMTKDGEVATWTGHGVGKFTGRVSAVSFRGAVYFQTSSAKLARLNTVAVDFEHEVDENGNTHAKDKPDVYFLDEVEKCPYKNHCYWISLSYLRVDMTRCLRQ